MGLIAPECSACGTALVKGKVIEDPDRSGVVTCSNCGARLRMAGQAVFQIGLAVSLAFAVAASSFVGNGGYVFGFWAFFVFSLARCVVRYESE